MISTDTDIPFRMRMQMAGVRKMVWDLNREIPSDPWTFWRFWISPEDGMGVFVQQRQREGGLGRASTPAQTIDGKVVEISDSVARRWWQDLVKQGWNQVSLREELR